MDANIKIKSRLFNTIAVEQREELDERLERCYSILQSCIEGLLERDSSEALNNQVCKGATQHEEIQLGLLYAILIDQQSAQKSHRSMTIVNRDGFNVVINTLARIIHEKWTKLLDSPKTQFLWLLRELMKNNVNNLETVISGCLKQIAGGDISQKNIYLAETVLELLMENRRFVEKNSNILLMSLYTYLRLITDHCRPELTNLRQKEVDYCISVLREKWQECMAIGRDLVRLLQSVSKIPEFTSIWYDMMYNPSALSSTFTGVDQIMKIKSSRVFIRSRLTPDMEFKLHFLTTKVAFGNQKRYQDWFHRQYLSTPESQTLRCDIIRYICAVVHPSNDILSSNITPRWAVIGWLLSTCTSNVAACDAKLSLFFDWLFFDPEKDNILNIEPAILVMLNSMRGHLVLTVNLLDFLCRIMKNFCFRYNAEVKQGIHNSFETLLNKKVVQSLEPLLENGSFDKELKLLIRESFGEFMTTPLPLIPPQPITKLPTVMDIDNSVNNNINNNDKITIELEAQFSDGDDDINTVETTNKLEKVLKIAELKPITERLRRKNGTKPETLLKLIEKLDGDTKTYTIELEQESDTAMQCEIMDKLIEAVIEEGLDNETAMSLAVCVCQIIDYCFHCQILPKEPTEESLENSIGAPLFVIFRYLCTVTEEASKQTLLQLLQEMYSIENRIGHRFLYFLKVSKQNDDKMVEYKDWVKTIKPSITLENCLMNDLKTCGYDDPRLFAFLIPDVYNYFENSFDNCKLVRLIVSVLDGPLLSQLICQILQGHLDIFEDDYMPVINSSLDWESLEQYYLWQLLLAHNMPVETILPILPNLNFFQHADALQSILLLLRDMGPDSQTLNAILHRKVKESDVFTVSVLKSWADSEQDKLADNFHKLFSKLTNSRKRPRNQISSSKNKNVDKNAPSIEQILLHLEHYRHTVKNASFLMNETMQTALQIVQNSSSEAVKSKFSDLLALVEDIGNLKTGRVLRGRKGQSSNVSKAITKRRDSSSEESSDEDEQPTKSKKRKKISIAPSDSD